MLTRAGLQSSPPVPPCASAWPGALTATHTPAACCIEWDIGINMHVMLRCREPWPWQHAAQAAARSMLGLSTSAASTGCVHEHMWVCVETCELADARVCGVRLQTCAARVWVCQSAHMMDACGKATHTCTPGCLLLLGAAGRASTPGKIQRDTDGMPFGQETHLLQ